MSLLRAILPTDSFKRTLFILFLVIWALSCVNLPYPKYFAMQHVPTVLALVALPLSERKLPMDRLGFALVILFLLLHVLGARYLYSNVPYDDWSQRIIGVNLTAQFGFERNHYDRLVHLCFGLLFIYPLRQMFERHAGLGGWWPAILAVCAVLAASAVYEIGEWATAMTFAPDWAEAYNGQQGDVWDAQRDMALAAVGAFVSAGLIRVLKRRS